MISELRLRAHFFRVTLECKNMQDFNEYVFLLKLINAIFNTLVLALLAIGILVKSYWLLCALLLFTKHIAYADFEYEKGYYESTFWWITYKNQQP